MFQPQGLSSKYDEIAKRRQKKENRKSKNLLTEVNSDEIPGHKFEDLDSVLQVMTILLSSRGIVSWWFPLCDVAGSWRGRRGGKGGD